MSTTGREFRLASRPVGAPRPENFALAEVLVPELEPGQVLVRNRWLSVDPYMRGRMSDAKSYGEPYRLGEALWGGAVGEVVESTVDGLAAGDVVVHFLGWREYSVLEAAQARKVDPDEIPPSAHLGVLGLTGLSAYAGMVRIANVKAGDVVFVSAAAGAVGSVAGQIARLRGASKVIGSAGSAEKVRHLKEDLGFDEAFDYKDGPVTEQLALAAPEGLDVCFDNVGGDHLEAAIDNMKPFGRIAVCGAISRYTSPEFSSGSRNLSKLAGWRLRIEGFLVSDHDDLMPSLSREVGGWIRSGDLRYRETVVEGFENTPQAFMDMLVGGNIGKMVVKL